MQAVIKEILSTDRRFLQEIKDNVSCFEKSMIEDKNRISSFEFDYLQFERNKLKQVFELYQQYWKLLETEPEMDINDGTQDQYFDHILQFYLGLIDEDRFIETFIVTIATALCLKWKKILDDRTDISQNQVPINFYFLSRLPRYSLLFQDLKRKTGNADQNLIVDTFLGGLKQTIEIVRNQGELVSRIRMDEKLFDQQIVYFVKSVIGLRFEIREIAKKSLFRKLFTKDVKKFEDGALLISKCGELSLCCQQQDSSLEPKSGKGIIETDSESEDLMEYSIVQSVDLKNVRIVKLIYNTDSIQINSDSLNITIYFRKKELQISTWNSINKHREYQPSFLDLHHCKYPHDVSLKFC